jgi:hypothetical protein
MNRDSKTPQVFPVLPVGIFEFEELIRGNFAYVDKTEYFPELLEEPKYIFCARPRRFGKSLTLSALDAFCSGRDDLFRGLAAESYMRSPDFVAHPVIRLDMSVPAAGNTIAGLSENVMAILGENAARHNVRLHGSSIQIAFYNLLSDVYNSTGKEVVLLIDEYDAPVIDAITSPDKLSSPDLLPAIRSAMQNFYWMIKSSEDKIELAFITGITKFSRMGVFSKLNNLKDISLSSEHAAFMGYTQKELETNFKHFITLTAKKLKINKKELLGKIKNMYDGFSFDGKETLYNPFSILSFFDEQKFGNFWMESGSNTIIRQFLKDKSLTVDQFQGKDFSYNSARTPGEIDATTPEGFLYQSGYLTLRYVDDENFILEYPNLEVRAAISQLFVETIYPDWNNINSVAKELSSSLASVDISGMVSVLFRLLAGIYYKDHLDAVRIPKVKLVKITDGKLSGVDEVAVPLQQLPSAQEPQLSTQADLLETSKGEYYYRSLFHACFWMAGAKVTHEKPGNLGNLDLKVCYGSLNYVFELKTAENDRDAVAAAMRGMHQIHSRGYGLSLDNPIFVSIAIDRAKRNIACCLLKKDGHETSVTVEYGDNETPYLSQTEIGALPSADTGNPEALPSADTEKQ